MGPRVRASWGQKTARVGRWLGLLPVLAALGCYDFAALSTGYGSGTDAGTADWFGVFENGRIEI